jgi:hypothetical protein
LKIVNKLIKINYLSLNVFFYKTRIYIDFIFYLDF